MCCLSIFCLLFFFLMIRRPPRSTPLYSSAASDVYKRQVAQDVEVVEVPLKELALELGNSKVENMVMLGAYIAKKPMITIEGAIASFQDKIGEAKPQVISLNRKALEAGYNWVRDHYCD